MKKILSIVIVILLTSVGFISNIIAEEPTLKRIIYVDDDGADYTKIQDAIDNANDGDTVYVYSGTYFENVVVKKSIHLVGEDRNFTIVDGGGVNDTILVNAEWVTVSNLGVSNSSLSSYQYGGIHTKANYTTIKNNHVFKNKVDGILIESHYNIILNNQVIDNENDGIKIRYASNNIIVENICQNIKYNSIYLAMLSHKNIVYKNIVTNGNDALLITDGNDNIMRENIVDSNSRNGLGINEGRRNIVYDNTFSNNGYNGAELLNAAENFVYNNNFLENNHNNKDWDGGNHWYFDYPIGGNYWDDYYNGSDDYHGENQDLPGSDGIWDDPYLISKFYDIDKYPYVEPNGWVKEPVGADLDCLGMLSWDTVEPNTNLTGRLLLFNNGESGSLLNWERGRIPLNSGISITPGHGENLIPENGYIPLTINIITPDIRNTEFSYEYKIYNTDNESDYHIFTVSFTTSKTKTKTIQSLIIQFLDNHPNMFPILRYILRLK